MTFDLAISTLRKHRWSYGGLAVVVFASSVVVGSSFILFESANTSSLDLQGLSGNAAAKLTGLALNGRFMASFMAVLSVFVTSLLVFQSVGFVIDGRRRELALMRLVGASPGQASLLVVTESALVGASSAVVGALLAIPISKPYAALLSTQGNWPPDLAPSPHLSSFIWCVAAMTLVTTLPAYGAATRIGRIAPIEAVRLVERPRQSVGLARWFTAAVGGAIVVLGMVAPAHSMNPQISTSLVAAGATLTVSALSPLGVSTVARALGGLLGTLLPGSGLLAHKRVEHTSRRSAALASPIIVLLGLGAVFGMMAQTGRAEMAVGLSKIENADVVIEQDRVDTDPDQYARALGLKEVGAITKVTRADDWSWGERGMPEDDFPQLLSVDNKTIGHFLPLDFLQGSLGDVQGTDVAMIGGSGRLGERFTLRSPSGQRVVVRVTAVVAPTSFVYGTFLVNDGSFDVGTGGSTQLWLAESSLGTSTASLQSALDSLGMEIRPETRAAWVTRTVETSVSNQRSAILTLVGGAAVVALFSLGQANLSSIRERQQELKLVKRVGASNGSVVAMVTLEATIILISAVVFASITIGISYVRMHTALYALGSPIIPVVPWGLLLSILLATLLVAMGTSVVGTQASLRSLRRQAHGHSST